MTAPTDRLAQNRTIFRSVNEHVREMSLRQDIVPWTVRTEYFCECASPECLETIELTLSEFEAVRAEEGTFVVCPGHVTSSLTVVEAADRYLIVERRRALVMTGNLDRLARNQALFREVNERIEEVAGGAGPVEFLCECSRTDCIDTIELTVAQYEEVRSDPTHFLIVSDHGRPDLDRVIAAHHGWDVVEKVEGVEVVTELDSRESSGG